MAGWQAVRLGDVIQINPRRELARGRAAPRVTMEDLEANSRAVARFGRAAYAGSGSRFRNGDTLLARITPCLENGKTAFVTGLAAGEVAFGSTEFIVLAGRPSV